MLSEQELLQLKKLRDFLTTSFKGASVADLKIDDVVPILDKIMELTEEKNEMKCLSNIQMDRKADVLKAIELSGSTIEWRDHPDDSCTFDRKLYGSIWSSAADESEFWNAYRNLQNSKSD